MHQATHSVSHVQRVWAVSAPALKPLVGRRVLVDMATIASFIGVILATNYALAGLPNVKLFDLMVFVAGYTLGLRRGMAVAAGAWLIYGNFNPWGTAGPVLLATLMGSEMVYAAAGAGMRMLVPPDRLRARPGKRSLLLAAVAVACTAAYDGATNVYTGLAWAQFAGSSDYGRWVLVALFSPGALMFSAVHVGSNILSFSLAAPLLIKGIEKGKEALPWLR